MAARCCQLASVKTLARRAGEFTKQPILAIIYSFGVLAITSITHNTRKGYDRQLELVYKTCADVTASSPTSMVHESFRASFRRVNVASETKASPAAARPAARPQLSWRASAPEYGTFE